MEYNFLGSTGLQVSALSFGSWVTFGNQISDDVAKDLMVLAYEQGVNFFDNAEAYAQGKSEIIMGQILKDLGWERTTYLVSSKVFWGGDKPNQTGLSRKHVFEACHVALRRLQVEYLDLFFCHRPDPNTPIDETVWAMNHLMQQGKILYWGTSEWSAQQIMHAHMVAARDHLIGPVMEQPQYNMFTRYRVEMEYKRIYETIGLGTTVWSPLASGTLSDKYIGKFPEGTRLSIDNLAWLRERSLTTSKLAKIERLNEMARDLGTTLPKMAIAWCLKNKRVDTVILGASRVDQLQETLGSLQALPLLTESIMQSIEDILGNKPLKPTY
jgi:voltage-dependent potassium channel beta subunit